jgi:SNF2 family DNA or RNA helicase
MAFELMPYQRETVEFGKKNKYCVYALEQGLGKSYSALVTAMETNSNALIICPAYLRLKWKSEIKKFFPEETVSLFNSDKEFYPLFDTRFTIISYHYVEKAEKLFQWADMVIVDEVQHYKSLTARRTEAFHRLIYENSVKRCLLLTGTPISNRVYELYSLLAICNYNPEIEESKFLKRFDSYVKFANHFSHLREFEIYRGNKRVKVQKWEGVKNLEELKQILKDYVIRFKSEDVLDLPPYSEVEIPVSYDDKPELLEVFSRFTNNAFDEEVVKGVDAKVKAGAALAKAPFTVDYVKGLIANDQKVVVYTDHVEACKFIAEKLGVTPITGETSMKVRQKLADDFMVSKDSLVIVATIGSFSTGIDLYSSFNMVFNDLPFVPGILEQAKYRIRRIGQNKRCVFHYILGSIQDQKILKILNEKFTTIRRVI